jgi:hypothetical protein
MDKQIITATVRSDKTISLSLTEPFYFTFFQNFFSLGPLPVLQHNLPRIFSQEYAFEGQKYIPQQHSDSTKVVTACQQNNLDNWDSLGTASGMKENMQTVGSAIYP